MASGSGARPSRSRRRASRFSRSAVVTAGCASWLVRRFESQPWAAGPSAAIDSIASWLSPPIVHSSGERESASKSSDVPERGGATTKTGRTSRRSASARRARSSRRISGGGGCGGGAAARRPANGAAAARPPPAARLRPPPASASSGLSAGVISICCAIRTASIPFGSLIAPFSGASSSAKESSSSRNLGQPSSASPLRAQALRQSRCSVRSARSSATRAASSPLPAAASASSSPASRSCSQGLITTGRLLRSVGTSGSSSGFQSTGTGRNSSPSPSNGRDPAATRSQKAADPTVSATRWMRRSPVGLRTLWRRHASKIQTSPGAMWRERSSQMNSIAGSVTIGMWTRTRSAQ